MGFFTSQADLMQRRLFRLGYKCVLLSDVDEMIVPDPTLYPGYQVALSSICEGFLIPL